MGRARRSTNHRSALRRAVPVILLAVVSSACGGGETSVPPRIGGVPETVALGRLPEPLSDGSDIPAPPTTPPPAVPDTTAPPSEAVAGAIADSVVGYRVLLIGDTLLASTAPRNDGIMCQVLNDFGWTIEIAAEKGRFIEFGSTVLDQRLEPSDGEPWDVAAIMFGNHFDGDLDAFSRRLDTLLERLSPRPTIVYTLSELDDESAAINQIIRQLPRSAPNVVVVDWAAATEADPDGTLDGAGPQLTSDGSGLLVLYTAAALGKTPGGERGESGECLPSVFVDDSAIVL